MSKRSPSPSKKNTEAQSEPLPQAILTEHLKTLGPLMRRWRENQSVPQVQLLAGTNGIGKRELVLYLAQWLMCEKTGFSSNQQQSLLGNSENAFPPSDFFGGNTHDFFTFCGTCSQCLRAENKNWIDFSIIEPVEEGGTLKIDQFRKMKEELGFSAFDGAFRITLINKSDRMTVQAANSVLKILEEPPAGWLFFLTAADPALLLPTLVSRCQVIRLHPLSDNVLTSALTEKNVNTARINACVTLAQGSYHRALKLSDDIVWEKRNDLIRFIEKPGQELNSWIDWASQESSNLDLLLDLLEFFCSDHLKKLTSSAVHSPRELNFWTSRAERLFEARHQATLPLNKKLLIQDLLSPFLNRRAS